MQSPRTMMILVVASCLSTADGQYAESFDTDHGGWQTWVRSGDEPPINHADTGGVGGSGHVFVNLASIGFQGPLSSPNDYIYWAAYLYAEDSGIGRFDMSQATVSLSARGDQIDLQSGELYLYISRYDQDTGENAIFRADTPVTIGTTNWAANSFDLAAVSWVEMVQNGFFLSEVLAEVTEFGFVVAGVAQTDDDPSGTLRIDEFQTDAPLIPAPATGLVALAGTAGLATRRRR
jgi:hypothetical protein